MAIPKGGRGGDVVQSGTVVITAVDDTGAGIASAQASVEGASKRIAASANKASKPISALGDTARKSTDKAGEGFNRVSGAVSTFASGVGKVPSALGAVTAGLTRMLPGIGAVVGALTAGVALFDAWATESDAARKATISMQISIDGARDAFGGMVSDMDLARSANKAFALGVAENGVQFAALARGVSTIAMNLGEDNLQLMDNAVTAIGRGSALILDNLGIILNQTEAEKIYAEHLGITTKQLTELNKAEAFGFAAKMKIAQAGDTARASVDGLANSYVKAKIQLENFKNGIVGLNVNVGKVRDTVRGMAPEVLELFGSRQREDVGAINRELSKRAEEQAKEARAFGDINAKASDFLVTYEDILAVADELGQVETMRGGQLDFENRKKREKELNRLAQEALGFQEDKIRKSEAQAKIAERDASVKRLNEEADALDHQAKLLEFQKNKEGEILMLQAQAIEKRKEAAGLTNDQNAALEQTRALELLLAAPLKKASGGGSGPSEADRVRAAGEATTQLLADQIKLLEVQGQLRGTELADAGRLAEMRLESALAELDLERRVLEVTRAKNSVERTKNENRLAAIAREEEFLRIQAAAESRQAANDLVAKAIEDTARLAELRSEAARQDSEAQGNVIELNQVRLAREEQAIRQAGALRQAAAKHDLERAKIAGETEAALHGVRMRQLAEEHAAKLRTLQLREDTIRGTVTDDPLERLRLEDELKQVLHDKDIERQNYALALARANDAEEVRLFNEKRNRLIGITATVESSVSALAQIYGEVSNFATFVQQKSAEQQEAALAREVEALNAKGRAQQAAIDRELKGADGNAAKQNEIRRKGARQQAELQAKIEKANADHQERQRKQESKAAGIKLLIDGAVNTAKAVSAFASYNFVQGALYTAAAAFNFAQGGMLIAGNVPGGAGGSGSSAAMSGGGGGDIDRETSAAASTPGSVPGEAARRSTSAIGQAGQQSGGNVVNIYGGVHANGAIDDEFAEKLAFKLRETGQSREGAA